MLVFALSSVDNTSLPNQHNHQLISLYSRAYDKWITANCVVVAGFCVLPGCIYQLVCMKVRVYARTQARRKFTAVRLRAQIKPAIVGSPNQLELLGLSSPPIANSHGCGSSGRLTPILCLFTSVIIVDYLQSVITSMLVTECLLRARNNQLATWIATDCQ